MAYAIIEAGGTQLRVEPGRFYDINRVAGDVDSQVTIDRVLLVQNDGDISVGQPLVEGAVVTATILRHLRGRKIIVYKMRPKKKTRKKQGHRQELTRLMIDSISLNGSVVAGTETTQATEPEAEEISNAPEVAVTSATEAAEAE